MPAAGAPNPFPIIAVAIGQAYGRPFQSPAHGSRPAASPPPSVAMIDALIALEDDRIKGDDGYHDDEPEAGCRL